MTAKTVRLKGEASVQGEKAVPGPEMTLSQLALKTPIHLIYSPDTREIEAAPVIRVRTVQVGSQVRVSGLSVSGPLTLNHTPSGWAFQGTPEVTAKTVRLSLDSLARHVGTVAR